MICPWKVHRCNENSAAASRLTLWSAADEGSAACTSHVTRYTSHITRHTSPPSATAITLAHLFLSNTMHTREGGEVALILTPLTLHINAHQLMRVGVKPPRLVPLLPAALVDDRVQSASP